MTRPAHSVECEKLIPRPYPLMDDLDELEQGYILNCSNSDHDAVRRMMGFKERLDPSTQQLVKIHV